MPARLAWDSRWGKSPRSFGGVLSKGECGMEYTNSQVRDLIEEHIHSERDRAIMRRRLIDGIRLEPLAEEFNLSTVQVKRIVSRERNRIFKMIRN